MGMGDGGLFLKSTCFNTLYSLDVPNDYFKQLGVLKLSPQCPLSALKITSLK